MVAQSALLKTVSLKIQFGSLLICAGQRGFFAAADAVVFVIQHMTLRFIRDEWIYINTSSGQSKSNGRAWS